MRDLGLCARPSGGGSVKATERCSEVFLCVNVYADPAALGGEVLCTVTLRRGATAS